MRQHYPPSSQAYDKVWNAVFKTEEWLQSASAMNANVLLIGADLDVLSGYCESITQPHLALMILDRSGDLQYDSKKFDASFRGDYQGPGVYHLEQLSLTIGKMDVPEVVGKDFRYLFSQTGQALQTKYCFWEDPKKKIKTLGSPDIRGIGGPVTDAEKLSPIFLLHLQPPKHSFPEYFNFYKVFGCGAINGILPEQYIFRTFGGEDFISGNPPLVSVILGEQMPHGEHLIKEFRFIDRKHEDYDRQSTDWKSLAK